MQKPSIEFTDCRRRLDAETRSLFCRYGACYDSSPRDGSRTRFFILGGIIRDEILGYDTEILEVVSSPDLSTPLPVGKIDRSNNFEAEERKNRFLFVGASTVRLDGSDVLAFDGLV
jgi:hypothetical protein